MGYEDEKKRLLEAVRWAFQANLIRLSAGNISARIEDGGVVITPSGLKYRDMRLEDISVVDEGGKHREGPRPSSETPMHTAIYRHLPRVNSICHTHSLYAMVFAHLQEDVPVANIELLTCGAPIPVAPWATPGTPEAGEVTVEIFQSRPALNVILLRQHGLVAVGGDLEEAYEWAYNAEVGLKTYYHARLLGEPQPLTEGQIAQIKAVYGD